MPAMHAPRVLFVKLSSLGDVIHHLPAATDLRAHRPEARIDWAVEAPYAPLVALHPAIARVIPVPLRALRGAPLDGDRWRAFGDARRSLREAEYDVVVDAQGLLKSAVIARMARAREVAGGDSASAREAAAALFYGKRIAVPREMHAVERNRALVAGVFGYAVDGPPRYALATPPGRPTWLPDGKYAVLLHAASREAKRWPEGLWTALGRRLAEAGLVSVFPGGTDAERAVAARLAQSVPGALAAPAMDLVEAARLLGHAERVAGVDTGLTHLAVALGRPTVGIYRATRPALTGLHGPGAVNLGGPGDEPTADAVARAMGLA